jgi:hypothetical protein
VENCLPVLYILQNLTLFYHIEDVFRFIRSMYDVSSNLLWGNNSRCIDRPSRFGNKSCIVLSVPIRVMLIGMQLGVYVISETI